MVNTDQELQPGMHFIPCRSCGIFQLIMNHEDINLLIHHYSKKDESLVSLLCFNCQETDKLRTEVHNLNKLVFDLNARIETLSDIRGLEATIDESVMNLSVNHLNDNHSILLPNNDINKDVPEIIIDEVPDNSTNYEQLPLGIPHNENYNDIPSLTDSFSDNIINVDDPYLFDRDDPNDNNSINNLTILPNFENLLHPATTGHTDWYDTLDQPNISNTNSCTAEQTHIPSKPDDSADNQDTIKNTDTAHHDMLSKFQTNTTVRTILIGDSTITNVKPNKNKNNSDCFKVSRPNCTLKDIAETTNFFLDRLHKNVSTAVFQLCTEDMWSSDTETLKDCCKTLVNDMHHQSISVILSGPVPFLNMGNETLSRLSSFNQWLCDYCSNLGIPFVNNLDLFLNNWWYFSKNGKYLNNAGARLLEAKLATLLNQN